MKKIYTLDTIKDYQSNNEGKTVLAGGCFDILHPGHQAFLQAAKTHGDRLVILLESDEQIKKIKGQGRPKNPQQLRAENLISRTEATDVVLLNGYPSNNDYDEIVSLIKPAIIATTENDPYKFHKDRQAELVGGRVIEVIARLDSFSTTKLLEEL